MLTSISTDIRYDLGVFGFNSTFDNSSIILIPAEWEVTSSYYSGASNAPKSINHASKQIDFGQFNQINLNQYGVCMLDFDAEWTIKHSILKSKALSVIQSLNNGGIINQGDALYRDIQHINKGCHDFLSNLEDVITLNLELNKFVGLVGGDHSISIGYLNALSKRYDSFGVLHIDAHMDLRESYQGFDYSHASVMHHALSLPQISSITQLGIRDFSDDELKIVESNQTRFSSFYDKDIQAQLFNGISWHDICCSILDSLPKTLYISFDIDGLEQHYCPNTGTPVPGGLSFAQIDYFLCLLKQSDKLIIGFDLVEVCDDDRHWGPNIASRLLYRLSSLFVN